VSLHERRSAAAEYRCFVSSVEYSASQQQDRGCTGQYKLSLAPAAAQKEPVVKEPTLQQHRKRITIIFLQAKAIEKQRLRY